MYTKLFTLAILLTILVALVYWDSDLDTNDSANNAHRTTPQQSQLRRKAKGKNGKGKGGKGGKSGKSGKGGKSGNNQMIGDLPQETVEYIDSTMSILEGDFFQQPTAVQSAYLGAAATLSLSNLIKSGNATAIDMANAEDFKLRTVECMHHLSGGNISEISILMSIADAATIFTDEDALAFFDQTHFANNSFELYVRKESEWGISCDLVMEHEQEDGQQQSVFGSHVSDASSIDLSSPSESKISLTQKHPPRVSQAEADDGCDISGTVHVFHVNGINNEPSDRQASAVALRKLLANIEDISVSYIPNPTDGMLSDLFEVFKLKQKEYNLEHEDDPDEEEITLATVGRFLALRAVAEVSKILPIRLHPLYGVAYLAAVIEAWAHVESQRAVERSDRVIAQIQSKLDYSIKVGRGVVLVPHSQGCLLSNEAWQGLTSQNQAYVSIVAVGTPAAYVGNPSNPFDYVQRNDDRVVKYLPNVLPGNVEGFDANVLYIWRKNHDFVSSYIQDRNVGAVMRSKILYAIENVGIPSDANFGAGVISATLTWGEQPDLDLHVYEPMGTHVYFGNKVGQSGALDIDHTTGHGPENYVVHCSTLQTGSYVIGVHYYHGFGDEEGELRLFAGGQVRELTVPMYLADESGPVKIVATVEVTAAEPPTFEITVN